MSEMLILIYNFYRSKRSETTLMVKYRLSKYFVLALLHDPLCVKMLYAIRMTYYADSYDVGQSLYLGTLGIQRQAKLLPQS